MRVATIIAVGLLGTTVLAGAELAQAAIQHYQLNIPRQSLDSALKDLAQQTGLQIGRFSGKIDGGAMVGPVRGDQTPAQALEILLNHTGLDYKIVSDSTIAVYNPKDIASAQLASLPSSGKQATPGTEASSQSGQESSDSGNSSKEAGKKTSQDFRVAQVDQRATTNTAAISPSTSGSSSAQSSVLQEVVVTAQKREERLIDTPQSVSVVSASDISKLGATQFTDFANTVPGLDFTTAGVGSTRVAIRGVTIGLDANATVATYVDEVPFGSSSPLAGQSGLLDVGLFDVDRIEVLRGPQGTLYGASSMGGVIKYVTKMPDAEQFGGEVQAGASGTEHGTINYIVNGAVNVPIVSDSVALRASGFESHDGGYIDNLAQGRDNANRSDVYGGRLDLLIKPSDGLTIRLGAFLQDISRQGESTVDYTLAGNPVEGDWDQNRKFSEPYHDQFKLFSADIRYDLGLATITSISSYQTVNQRQTFDVSPIYSPFCAFQGDTCSAFAGVINDDTDKFTQELRLASKSGGMFEWLVGGFYTHQTSSEYEYFLLRGLSGNLLTNNLFTYFVPATYKEYAGFGDLTWHITSKFDVTGGLRYSRDDQDFSQTGTGLLGLSHPPVSAGTHVVTYLANMRYHFSNTATGYVRYATGYRPGGPNVVTENPVTGAPNGPATVQSDSLKSYEVGFKAETEDRRFSFDAATYDIEWRNIQVSVVQPSGFGTIENAPGGARIQGAELTLIGRPTDQFTASGVFAYQHAYLKGAAEVVGGSEGERLPNVPRFTAALNGDYVFPTGGALNPSIGATVRYVTDRYIGFGPTSEAPEFYDPTVTNYRLPAYTLADLRGSVTLGSTVVQLYAHNLFDERAQLGAYYPQFGTRIGLAQPRTVGVTATFHF